MWLILHVYLKDGVTLHFSESAFPERSEDDAVGQILGYNDGIALLPNTATT